MVETHRFFRFSLYGGDSPAFLGFHFMVETHLRQFFVYNKYMQFPLKNQYNSIILQKYKPPKECSLRGLKFFLKLYVLKRIINVCIVPTSEKSRFSKALLVTCWLWIYLDINKTNYFSYILIQKSCLFVYFSTNFILFSCKNPYF